MKKRNRFNKNLIDLLLENHLNKDEEEELKELLINEPSAINIDKFEDSNLKFGEIMADKISKIVGSWKFIIFFTFFLISWMILNTYILSKSKKIDPYPFILLNLMLSCISAIQAPIIMMSQNRKAKKDTLRNQNDYKIDLKSQLILLELNSKIDKILKYQKNK